MTTVDLILLNQKNSGSFFDKTLIEYDSFYLAEAFFCSRSASIRLNPDLNPNSGIINYSSKDEKGAP